MDTARKRIVAKVSGAFTFPEILKAIDGSVHDPAFQRGFDVFSDHTEVEAPITPPDARAMVNHLENLSDFLAGARWAVVTATPASYGMLRMVSVLAERVPMDVQVFESLEAAEAWLATPRG